MISKVQLVNFNVKSVNENLLPHAKSLKSNQIDTFQKQQKLKGYEQVCELYETSATLVTD